MRIGLEVTETTGDAIHTVDDPKRAGGCLRSQGQEKLTAGGVMWNPGGMGRRATDQIERVTDLVVVKTIIALASTAMRIRGLQALLGRHQE